MLTRVMKYFRRLFDNQRVSVALSKVAATMPLRVMDESHPTSWEFSGFSQNGEDGIIDFLSRKIIRPNRYFIEVGSHDGLENNTAYLAIARKFNGLMIEGDKHLAKQAAKMMRQHNPGVHCCHLYVSLNNIQKLLALALYKDPDVFSMDIDGMDYHIVEKIMELGFRPKIFVVEYNAVFGPERSITIKYKEKFSHRKAHPTELYFGASVGAWKQMFQRYGYQFLTVETRGVNAFFINPQDFPKEFLKALAGQQYQDNFSQLKKFRMRWDERFALIKDLCFIESSAK